MTTSIVSGQRPAQWAAAVPVNVGLRVLLPSGNTVMLMRPLVRPADCWDCAYLDALGRVRMVREDHSHTGAHAVTLTVQFLASHGKVVHA